MIDYANGVETMYSPNYIEVRRLLLYFVERLITPVNYGEGETDCLS
jgi:hypothetical protein